MVLYRLNADVSSENLSAIEPVLTRLTAGQVTETPNGLHVDGAMEGTDARDVNRRLLSALRRIEKRTRLRAEWTAGGTTYRFFDYASKSERPALPATREPARSGQVRRTSVRSATLGRREDRHG